ncbi:DUF4446 family protein [Cuneatibacter sp. NSJ-177]|jgi:hypothetical protein|uniref:DUF4446 family protein n=1 Tax=Cuneatibacter sp. NSJ-177 TaxID=2931401 RepID=UPI001FCFC2FE|nr:DUF4446 family protein [Cuneatibacter sp. NSJ-177]MCJ7836535.1 DUF4446 family protein [Cuneatibacter sp. NSJ-177]
MSDSILNQLGFDPVILFAIMAGLLVFLGGLVIINLIKMEKLYRRYDIFMRGKDAETLEDMIAEIYENTQQLMDQDLANKDVMKVISKGLSSAYQKTGVVKYNAFEGMGGQSSFALAVLDMANSGFLLNAMHSRNSCYIYVKEIKEGEPEAALGKEEKQALDIAMGKKDRFFH